MRIRKSAWKLSCRSLDVMRAGSVTAGQLQRPAMRNVLGTTMFALWGRALLAEAAANGAMKTMRTGAVTTTNATVVLRGAPMPESFLTRCLERVVNYVTSRRCRGALMGLLHGAPARSV